ncbi:MAG: aspartyl/asparaginyl beta-hydroxylase domain-containing protein [Halioglobus sp.]
MTGQDWGAIRLPLTYDAARLSTEVAALAETEWGVNGRIAPAFANTQAVFLKGFAAASGNPSMEDRDILAELPYAREMIYSLVPAQPQNCVLSYLPPKVDVGLHIDQGEYFQNTLRVHFPVTTNELVTMYFGACYRLQPGEVWLLNNCSVHGVENAHPSQGRIHLICDYLPSAALLELARSVPMDPGEPSDRLRDKLRAKTLHYSQRRNRDSSA